MKLNGKLRLVLIGSIIFFGYFNIVNAQNQSLDLEIEQLKKEIDSKQILIQQLEKDAGKYTKEIVKKQSERVTLKNQISVLDNRIAKTVLDTSANETEIDKTILEIKKSKLDIKEKEKEILNAKTYIVKTIRHIYKLRNTNYLEIIVGSNSLAEFFDQIKYLSTINQRLTKLTKKTEILKGVSIILVKKLEKQELALVAFRKKLSINKNSLGENKSAKSQLLLVTTASEKKFQELIAQIKNEHKQIDDEMKYLEGKMRKMLEERKILLGQAIILWPVNYPSGNVVITRFHDREYPFRYIYEHPGLDIRSPQGSYIKAASPGYVFKVKNGGRRGYSYISLMHSNNLSTVYGHVLKIFVTEGEFVKSGDIIALSGGLPGTPGAGRLTTGPHLHFEVRSNGIPVDPMAYLP